MPRTTETNQLWSYIDDLVLVVSDPIDGMFTTAIATVSLATSDGTVVPVAHGYATAAKCDQELIDKSISEAVERAVWLWLHDTGQRVGHTTIGCAAHPDAEVAESSAIDEAYEKFLASSRFRLGDLGEPDMPPMGNCRRLGDNRVEEVTWHDRIHKVVIAGSFYRSRRPRLVLASASYRSRLSPADAVLHARAEIAQVLPWTRQVAHQSRPWQSDALAESRVSWWSNVSPEVAHRIWRNLTRVSVSDSANASERLGHFIKGVEVVLSHALSVSIGGKVLYFRRATLSPSTGITGVFDRIPEPYF